MTISVCISLKPGETATHARTGLENQEYNDFEVLELESRKPLAETRNRLAIHASGDYLAFLDGDATPEPQWLSELNEGFESGNLAVGGPAYPPPDIDVEFPLDPAWHWLIGCGPYHDDVCMIRNTYGCNFAIRYDVFRELGGFNEQFGKGARIPQGEEAELAQRMYQEYGERMQYRPDAIVEHSITKDQLRIRSLLQRAYNQGYTKAHMDTESEEHDMIRTALKSLDPLQYGLLAAAGLGYARGTIA